MARRIKHVRGQMNLPFGQKRVKKKKREPRRKGPSLAERRVVKDRAHRLCSQAYAILKSKPGLFRQRDISYHLKEIGQFIGEYRKARLTYNKAEAAIGAATSILKEAGVKYKL